MVCRSESLPDVRDQYLGALALARDVVADVKDASRTRRRGEERIERRDTPRIRRRDGQPRADVVQRALADPADARLHRVQRGQQHVPARARLVTAVRDMGVANGIALAAVPARGWCAEERVDCLTLLGGRFCLEQVEVHQSPATATR